MKLPATSMRARRGFTLAEVAVTIVIVGIGMLLVLQGLNTAKMAAYQTKNLKLARELALLTLGQISSGLYQEDIQNGLHGSYAEEGFPDFMFDVAIGDDTLPTDGKYDGSFDSWHKPATTSQTDDKKKQDPKDTDDQPYEKVKIKISFPEIKIEKEQLKHELTFEQWIPWKQVYGSKDDTQKTDGSAAGSTGTSSGTTTGAAK